MSTNFLFVDNAQQRFAFTPAANFPAHNLIFTESEGDGIKSRLPFNIFSTLLLVGTYIYVIKPKHLRNIYLLSIGLVILHTACMLSALASCGAESWKPSAVGRAWLHNITQLHAGHTLPVFQQNSPVIYYGKPDCFLEKLIVCSALVAWFLRKHVWSALKRDREVSSP